MNEYVYIYIQMDNPNKSMVNHWYHGDLYDIYICMYVCMYISIYICVCIYICMDIYIYIILHSNPRKNTDWQIKSHKNCDFNDLSLLKSILLGILGDC